MPIWSRKWPFLDYTIEAAPLDQGVFGLWQRDELIFLGATTAGTSIRQCVLEHFKGVHGDESRAADHYSWEVADNPEERKSEVLRQFRTLHKRLPRLNKNESQ
jgi:hypothetical protein